MIQTIYSTVTGEVLRVLSHPDELAVIEPLVAGEGVIFERPGGDVYVDAGVFIPRPAQPSPYHEWDWPTKSWLPDVALARAKVSAAWEAWKQRKLLDGVRVGANLWPSDERFIRRLQYYVTAFDKGQVAGPVALRTKDNGTVEVAPAAVAPLLFVIETRQENVDKQAWNGKDALKLLNTVEEIIAAGPPDS